MLAINNYVVMMGNYHQLSNSMTLRTRWQGDKAVSLNNSNF